MQTCKGVLYCTVCVQASGTQAFSGLPMSNPSLASLAYLNPVVATAYQAAYTAALAAGIAVQSQTPEPAAPAVTSQPAASSSQADPAAAAAGSQGSGVSPSVLAQAVGPAAAGAAGAMSALRPMSPWPMQSLAFTQVRYCAHTHRCSDKHASTFCRQCVLKPTCMCESVCVSLHVCVCVYVCRRT